MEKCKKYGSAQFQLRLTKWEEKPVIY